MSDAAPAFELTRESALTVRGRRGALAIDVDLLWSEPVLALVGPSGAGKTSLVEAMLGLWSPEGRAAIRGRVLFDTGAGVRTPLAERRIGWLPQDLGLFPHLTVRENLRFGARARGLDPQTADDVAARLELGALLDRRAFETSGGERQRVALGRALASRPEVLVLDEPLSSLDRPLRRRILGDLVALKAGGMPMVYVSHDLHEVWALADVVAVLEKGRVVAFGKVREVLASPTAHDSLSLAGVENLLEGRLDPVDGEPALAACTTTAGLRLVLAAPPPAPPAGARVRVAVRAEDVVLATSDPGATSAQNVISGKVAEVREVAGAVLVGVDCAGERIEVQVTARAVRRLGLTLGRAVTLLVKAHAVHLVGTVRAPAGPAPDAG